MTKETAPILAASITASITLIVAVVALIASRWQEEYKARFARLYEERAKIIAKLYAALVELNNLFRAWMVYYDHFDPAQETERVELGQTISYGLGEFCDFYSKNKVWITGPTFKKLDQLYKRWDSSQFQVTLRVEKAAREDDFQPSENQDLIDVKRWIDTELRTALAEIESEFQGILGVFEPRRSGPPFDLVTGSLLLGAGLGAVIVLSATVPLSAGFFLAVASSIILGIGGGLLARVVSRSL